MRSLLCLFSLMAVMVSFSAYSYADILLEQGAQAVFPSQVVGQAPFVENADIATINVVAEGFLVVALNLGTTYIYGWDDQNNPVVTKVMVVVRGYERAMLDRKRYEQSLRDENGTLKITAGYKAGSGLISYGSGTATSNWNVSYVNMSAKTPIGDYFGVMQMERRDDISGRLVLFSHQFKGKNFSLGLGDNWASITPLTGTYLKYQGVQLSDVKISSANLSLYAGRTGTTLWGSDIWRTSGTYQEFFGGKIAAPVDKNLSVFGTLFFANRNETSGVSPYTLASVGFQRNFAPFTLNFEGAGSFFKSGSPGYAFLSRLGYSKDSLQASTEYRFAQNNYVGISEYSNYSAGNGLYNLLQYTFSNGLNLTARYNARRDPAATDTLLERDLGLYYQSPDFLSFQMNAADNDYRGFTGNGTERRLRFSVVKDYPYRSAWFTPASLYFHFQPSQISLPGSEDVANTRFTLGTRYLFQPIMLTAEFSNDSSSTVYQSTGVPISTYRLGLSTQDLVPFVTGPFGFGLNVSATGEQSYLEGALYSWMMSGDVEFRTNKSSWGQLYVRYTATRRSTNYLNLNSEHQLSFGMEGTIDTGFDLSREAVAGQLTGFVYEDINENGRRDDGEPAVKGFTVTLGDRDRTYDPDFGGIYTIKDVAASGWLTFRSSVYGSYRISANNPYRYELDAASQGHFELPVVFIHKIKAITFNDQNKNGILDDGEELLKNTSFFVTDRLGNRQLVQSPEGTIEFSFSGKNMDSMDIDLATVPDGLLPLSVDVLTQRFSGADEQTLYFPFTIRQN